MSAHAALDPEVKETEEFGAPLTLRRVPCACGWRGCWYSSLGATVRSFERHALGASPRRSPDEP